jgi:hypothetical protein
VSEDIHKMLRRLRNAVEEIIAVTKDDPEFMAPAAKLQQPTDASPCRTSSGLQELERRVEPGDSPAIYTDSTMRSRCSHH